MRKQEEKMERRMKIQALSGMLDFLGVIASAMLMILLVGLLIHLISWLSEDLIGSFAALKESVTKAILVE